MENAPAPPFVALLTILTILGGASMAGAQPAVTARLHPSGAVRFYQGATELALVELNAHGPQWKHAPQETATGQVTSLPDGGGKRVEGTLPIPNTGAGAIKFTQTVKPIPQGMQLEYDVSVTQTLRLNGLQLSICLPVAVYGGKELLMPQLEGEAQGATLPADQRPGVTYIWSGSAAQVQVAPGAESTFTIELRAPTEVMVQDLRQWEHPIYEIRFPALTEDGGRELTPEDRFHLDLTVTFASPVQIVGP